MYISTVYKLEKWQIFQEKEKKKNLCQVLTVIILKRKHCIQWRLYICNVTIQIPTKLKKIGSTGRNSMREENKLEKIWPLNLEGPQNYSSNERVKTLHMYSFYKNTLTFNCCFSNLSLLCFSWENAAGHISRAWGWGGVGWPPVWSPSTWKILGGGGLSTPNFTSSSSAFL